MLFTANEQVLHCHAMMTMPAIFTLSWIFYSDSPLKQPSFFWMLHVHQRANTYTLFLYI